MFKALAFAAAFAAGPASAQALSDAQIADIAYVASVVDIAAGKQALDKSQDRTVRDFAQSMIRDHNAVNGQALALARKLGITPQDNPTARELAQTGAEKLKSLSGLSGKAFDRAYAQNEVAYHRKVNGALKTVLIPAADNPELKALLQTGLELFQEHQMHAEHLAAALD